MHKNCPLVCETCEMEENELRCGVVDPNDNAYKPGDLNRMFMSIVSSGYYDDFNPSVLSAPAEFHNAIAAAGKVSNETTVNGGELIVNDGPWVVTFDDFLQDIEVEALIEWGHRRGFERSTGVGGVNADGTVKSVHIPGRTSENTWCQDVCAQDPLVQQLSMRISDVTQIPDENAEYLQLLSYTEGQKYDSHHDFIPNHVDRSCGNRVVTFFLYLSDVEEGGATSFTSLNLEVKPKKGKALLWPNVLDSDPTRIDIRTYHAALPVISGRKFAANAWLHLREFKQNNDRHCC